MKKFILILPFVLFSFKVYSQRTEYNYTCGRDNQTIIWTVTRKEDLIYLETIQGNEVHKYAINHDYKTISWEYANISENTNLCNPASLNDNAGASLNDNFAPKRT